MYTHIPRSLDRSEPKVHVVYQRVPVVPDILDLLDKWCGASETQKIVYADFLCRHEPNFTLLLHDCSDILFRWGDCALLKITLNVTGTRILVITDGAISTDDNNTPADTKHHNLFAGVLSFVSICVAFRFVSFIIN